MLRIHRSSREDSVVLAVSGRLDGEASSELTRAVEAEAGGTVVLDLEGMRLVGRDGVRLLAGFEVTGVRLEHCPEYVRRWIDAAG